MPHATRESWLAQTRAERIDRALDYVTRMGARDIDFVRAAHQYGVDRETLEVLYDQQYKQWAADRGYDF